MVNYKKSVMSLGSDEIKNNEGKFIYIECKTVFDTIQKYMKLNGKETGMVGIVNRDPLLGLEFQFISTAKVTDDIFEIFANDGSNQFNILLREPGKYNFFCLNDLAAQCNMSIDDFWKQHIF